jgi:hypothetical protein
MLLNGGKGHFAQTSPGDPGNDPGAEAKPSATIRESGGISEPMREPPASGGAASTRQPFELAIAEAPRIMNSGISGRTMSAKKAIRHKRRGEAVFD